MVLWAKKKFSFRYYKREREAVLFYDARSLVTGVKRHIHCCGSKSSSFQMTIGSAQIKSARLQTIEILLNLLLFIGQHNLDVSVQIT